MKLEYWSLLAGILALLFTFYLSRKVKNADAGSDRMRGIAKKIHAGALTFLTQQYRTLAWFVAAVALLLWWQLGWELAVAFVYGAVSSAIAGFIGMHTATTANVRTTQAATHGLNPALKIAFASGATLGLSVVGLGLIGVTLLYLWFHEPEIIHGFGLGASSIALFARVGGGIFTKAADVGADLVGKVEANLDEDDPRNPAVIADNVGDNVGDVAGMGADLTESYVGSLIAALTLGFLAFGGKIEYVILPLLIAAVGIVAAIVGSFFVRVGSSGNLHAALNKGIYVAGGLLLIGAYLLTTQFVDELNFFWIILTGLVGGILIGQFAEYYTSGSRKPVQRIAESAETGAGTNIITGLSVGMKSVWGPVLTVAVIIVLAFSLAGGSDDFTTGVFGIALAAVGMLSTLGITLAVDAYGPVADNAGGIAEMAKLPEDVRERTDKLDEVGNSTAAIGKGFAIGAASLAALSLITAFAEITELTSINLIQPEVIAGIYVGAMLPYFFSSLTMKAVGRAAMHIVHEVRRQFKEIPGLKEGHAEADYRKVIQFSTKGALTQMILPGLIAVLAPMVVGLVFGPETLAALLIGALASGFLMAVFMANTGGAWDNAKKYIEAGNLGGKGSDAHKAAVTGDTVGDPFKDTSGPSLNILINVMSLVALVIAPLLAG